MKDDFRRPILAAFGGVMMIAGAGMAGALDRPDDGAKSSVGGAPVSAARDLRASQASDDNAAINLPRPARLNPA